MASYMGNWGSFSPINGVISLLISGDGAHLVGRVKVGPFLCRSSG